MPPALHTALATLSSDDFPTDGSVVANFTCVENLSSPFCLELELLVHDAAAVTTADILGSRVALTLEVSGCETRVVHGLVAEVRDLLAHQRWTKTTKDDDAQIQHRRFCLKIVPRIHRLALIETQEVYIDMSIPDILREKLQRAGFTDGVDFALNLTGSYPVKDFVVQYKESDLCFLQRLCEHVGIAYRFDQSGDCDKIVFSDHNAAFVGSANLDRVFDQDALCAVRSLSRAAKCVPALFAVQDYNYRTPLNDVLGQHVLPEGFGGGVVEYGSHAKTADEANLIAKVRGEEQLTKYDVFEGTSGLGDFETGQRFCLTRHPILRGDLEMLVVSLEQRYSAIGFAEKTEAAEYTNRFRAIPAKVTYRPSRSTPKPRIYGFVTGMVEPVPDEPGAQFLGPAMDEEGRYWVRFHFDTAEPGTKKASRPIRMAQSHAGAGYGTHFPLRPGVEVLLAFHDGDPDRPLIVGAVPNGVNPSPVTAKSSQHSETRSASGILIQFRDSTVPA